MYCTILAQFSTAPKILLISKIWVGVYGVWTLLLLVIGYVGFNSYDYARCPSDQVKQFYANESHAEFCQQDPAVPVAIMSVLDYGWFILLLFATPLLPGHAGRRRMTTPSRFGNRDGLQLCDGAAKHFWKRRGAGASATGRAASPALAGRVQTDHRCLNSNIMV
eukprot:scaffold46177_cov52-Phaeocystis_antarctica.AAC.4